MTSDQAAMESVSGPWTKDGPRLSFGDDRRLEGSALAWARGLW